MALGSWQGLYNAVILDLMEQGRERQLLLLMAIASHCDAFGFCYPGRARLGLMRHHSKTTILRDEAWLVEQGHITVEEVHNPRRRQDEPHYQVSPRTLYVREDLQAYCEAVFDGVRDRDYGFENRVLVNLFSTNDSQPENQPEPEPETEPALATKHRTRKHNQLRDAERQKGRNATTTGNAPEQSEAPKSQRRKAQDRKNEPPGGGSVGDEFDALLSPTVDNDRLIQEIIHIASTTQYQAAEAVENYPREGIVWWLRKTAVRRQNGTLSKPGGWFFTSLRKNVAPLNVGPNGQSTYQSNEDETRGA